MNKGIIIAGNMIMDFIKTIEAYPERLSLTSIKSISHSIGGAVCNCGIDLAKIDPSLPITALGAIGNDEYGNAILQELANYSNIDTKYIIQKSQKTSFTDVMTEEKSGNRTFFYL